MKRIEAHQILDRASIEADHLWRNLDRAGEAIRDGRPVDLNHSLETARRIVSAIERVSDAIVERAITR